MAHSRPQDFRKTFRHRTQRMICGKVERLSYLKLYEKEKRVLTAILNHAFRHMNEGEIYAPGRELLARKAGVCIRTVARTLSALREAGVIVNVAYANGARNRKTQFSINWLALFDLIGLHMADTWEWALGAVEHKAGKCVDFFRATFSVPLIIRTSVRRISGGLFMASDAAYRIGGVPRMVIPEQDLPF